MFSQYGVITLQLVKKLKMLFDSEKTVTYAIFTFCTCVSQFLVMSKDINILNKIRMHGKPVAC